MTVTTKIVIGAAVVLLLGGYVYMRQHARELANKYKKIQRQKFKSKEPVIIEEILAQLNGGVKKGHQKIEQRFEPSFAGNGANYNLNQDVKTSIEPFPTEPIPLEPTAITTPVRIPQTKQTVRENRVSNGHALQGQQKSISKAPALPQTSIMTKPQNIEKHTKNSLQERLHQETNFAVNHPIKPPPPNPTAKSKIEEIEIRDLDLPKFVKENQTEQINQYKDEAKASFPARGQIKATSIAAELNFQEGETLYTHINDYAKWVASQSNHFTLEYYENDALIEVVPLIFNSEELSKLYGHWFEMFRPLDLNELFAGIDKNKSTLYCSFSRQDVEHLTKPALQILAYVEFEASSRYEQVLEECALKEFVNFLQELKNLAGEEG